MRRQTFSTSISTAYRVRARRDIEDVRAAVASRVGPLGRRVAAVISYDACAIAGGHGRDEWFAMAAEVESRLLIRPPCRATPPARSCASSSAMP